MNAKDMNEREWCEASGRLDAWLARGRARGRLKYLAHLGVHPLDGLSVRARERLKKAEAVVEEIMAGPNPHPQMQPAKFEVPNW